MAVKKLFCDGDSNLECYVNDAGKVYIGIDVTQDHMEGGSIALDKETTEHLIDDLKKFVVEMD